MPAVTTAYRNAIATYLLGGGAPAAIDNAYVDIFNGDPQGAGTSVLTTISGSATRPIITGNLAAASGGSDTTSADIVFTTSAVAGATSTHLAVYTAATAGTLIMSAAMPAPLTISAGQRVKIAATALTAVTS